MSNRRLSPPERAVWGQVARTVTPFEGKGVPEASLLSDPVPQPRPKSSPSPRPSPRPKSSGSPKQESALDLSREPRLPLGSDARAKAARSSANTLDAQWDRKLSKGMASPDRTVDLHGETLNSAHVRLNFALADAVICGDRLILLITGKQPRENPRLPPTSRGVIRASVADWLASSPHANKIAAVRNAHPRHGGGGALYVIMRRAK